MKIVLTRELRKGFIQSSQEGYHEAKRAITSEILNTNSDKFLDVNYLKSLHEDES